MLDIVAVNRSAWLVLTDDGETVNITNFLDVDGDETDNPDNAEFAIVQTSDGQWWSVTLNLFDPAVVN